MSFPGVVRSNGTGGHISSVVVLWSSWVASASRWLTGPRSFFTIVVEAKTIRCRLTLLMLGKTTRSSDFYGRVVFMDGLAARI